MIIEKDRPRKSRGAPKKLGTSFEKKKEKKKWRLKTSLFLIVHYPKAKAVANMLEHLAIHKN